MTSTDDQQVGLSTIYKHKPNNVDEFKPAPSSTFTSTVNNLTSWCQHVIRLLTAIEWQHVGFEVTTEGDVNLHRPLYRCPVNKKKI
jgi:hypothetical protein